MNSKKAAEALRTLSLGFAELAEALNDQPQVSPLPAVSPAAGGPSPAPDSYEASPFEDEPAQVDRSVCPVHKKPFSPGNYGYAYCREKGGDPAWMNQRGYCRLSEKNIDAYLRVNAA